MLRNSTLENSHVSSSNPWSPSSTFVNLGSLQRVISVAEKTGHIQKESSDHNKTGQQALERCQSIHMIQVLKEITKLGQAIDKVNLEIQRLVREAETIDVTHVDGIGRRTHQLQQLSIHLSSIIQQKDELITRLQQPFVGSYLITDAAYHSDTSSALPEIAANLACLPKQLEDISWANGTNLGDGKLENVLSGIESSFADLQRHFRAALKSRKVMEQIRYLHTADNEQKSHNSAR